MVSRRRFLRGAAVPLSAIPLAGCPGRVASPGTGTAGESDRGDPNGDGTGGPPTTQYQYDAANTGVVDTAAPDSPGRRWRTRLDPAEGGVAVAGDTVVVAARDVVALDRDDGEQRWSADVGNSLAAPPTATAETAYVPTWNGAGGTERGVVAVDLADGSERWRAAPWTEVSAPLTLADGTLYAGNGLDETEVTAIDADDGSELWRFEAGEHASTAAVADGTAFVCGGQRGVAYALDAESGEQLWRFEASDEVWAAPTVQNGAVYVGARDGRVSALDPANGDELWHVDTGDPIRHSVAATDEAVYVPTEQSLVALDPDGDRRWSGSLGYDGRAPTVTREGVVCTDRERLYCFDTDGTERWRFDVRDRPIADATYGGVRSPPVVVDGTVYFVSFAGDVYALAEE
ncbi:outer membrane protein assembly factor BamB family protein [Halosimplex halophilum]|uniref:outer membrane protein assembly factor BamB family protein n=1 Tax=Halosimplex halophilum TaxID=2559572 RepID=UPI00107F4DEC|nr:PQQ-binding-like beta-propeller repeat protein [Halosimplex halophilum]